MTDLTEYTVMIHNVPLYREPSINTITNMETFTDKAACLRALRRKGKHIMAHWQYVAVRIDWSGEKSVPTIIAEGPFGTEYYDFPAPWVWHPLTQAWRAEWAAYIDGWPPTLAPYPGGRRYDAWRYVTIKPVDGIFYLTTAAGLVLKYDQLIEVLTRASEEGLAP